MTPRKLLSALAHAALPLSSIVALTGCSINTRSVNTPPPMAPSDSTHVLLEGVHLGDNFADGQAFGSGRSSGARACALISVPVATEARLHVEGLRNSEVLSDVLTVNGRPHPLGITLEREFVGPTSNAMVGAPVFAERLAAGANQVCLVAGVRPSGDLDDFEVERVLIDVRGIAEGAVSVNALPHEGTPPLGLPPSLPWGTEQSWPAGRSSPPRRSGAWGWSWSR